MEQVIMVSDGYDFNYMIGKLNETYEEASLKINFQKTKDLVIVGRAENLNINGNKI